MLRVVMAIQTYYKRYQDRVPVPDVPEGFIDTLPTNYKHLWHGFGLQEATPETIQLGRELYWGLVNWLDDEIGKLSTALRNSDVADNTVVIYCADHGESKGDHGLWWKSTMYEQSARIPLIISWPHRWQGNQRREGACSLVDLVQTIAHLAEAKAPKDWNGDSMLDWMDDENVEWKDLAVSEYYAYYVASGYAMLRQGPWKYVYHTKMDNTQNAERELYNLDEDPSEFDNLSDQPKHANRLATMHATLIEELGRDPEEAEAECRAYYSGKQA